MADSTFFIDYAEGLASNALSNSNRTANVVNASAIDTKRRGSTVLSTGAGKFYFEFNTIAVGPGSLINASNLEWLGLVTINPTTPLVTWAVALTQDLQEPTPITGHVLGFAVDLIAGKCWYRLDGGAWSFYMPGPGPYPELIGNPATGDWGYPISAGDGVTFGACLTKTGSHVTINGAGPFAYTVPDGYTAWENGVPAVSLTSYNSFGGSNNRAGVYKPSFSTSPNVSGNGRYSSLLLNGNVADNFFFTSGNNAGSWIEFAINGLPRVIDGFTVIKNSAEGNAVWAFQGWDGSSWITLTTFQLNDPGNSVKSFTNTTAFQKYRFYGLSGTRNGDPYIREVNFKIDSTYDSLAVGDRSANIVVTSNVPIYRGAYINLVKWQLDGSNATSFGISSGDLVAGQYLQFTFNDPIVLKHAFFYHYGDATDSLGIWKWQRHDAGGWVDIAGTQVEWRSPSRGSGDGNGWGGYNGDRWFDISSNTVSSNQYRMVYISGASAAGIYVTLSAVSFEWDIGGGGPVDTGDATATLSGTAMVGSTLTCTFNNDDPDGSATGVTYQWVAGGFDISGATGSTFTLTSAQAGKQVHCRVQYVDGAGNIEGISTANSLAVATRYILAFTDDSTMYAKITLVRRIIVAFTDNSSLSFTLTHLPVQRLSAAFTDDTVLSAPLVVLNLSSLVCRFADETLLVAKPTVELRILSFITLIATGR